MNTDPIADLFTRIRNAQNTGLADLRLPYSEIKMELAKLMVEKGFLADAKKEGSRTEKKIHFTLIYRDGQPAIHEIVRISKPGQRIYASSNKIKPYKRGRGLVMVSTSKGLMSGHQARQENIGGELIGKIW
jgi:small subunit ribosomal protein S8